MSFLYEGDIKRLGGSIVLEDIQRKGMLCSIYKARLLMFDLDIACNVKFSHFSGYEVLDFDSQEEKDELTDRLFNALSEKRIATLYALKLFGIKLFFFLPILFITVGLFNFSSLALFPFLINTVILPLMFIFMRMLLKKL